MRQLAGTKKRYDEGSRRSARRATDEQRRLAEASTNAQRELAYVAEMQLAHQLYDAGKLRDASELLRKLRPGLRETELRGYDWYLLRQLCGGDMQRLGDPRQEYRAVSLGWVALSMKTETVWHWLSQCICVCGYSSIKDTHRNNASAGHVPVGATIDWLQWLQSASSSAFARRRRASESGRGVAINCVPAGAR